MLIIILLASYLLGSFPTGTVVGKVLKGIDIRQYGSGNAGATNVFRVLGPVAGVFVFLVDFGKGMVAVLLFTRFAGTSSPGEFELLRILVAVAVISGHVWTIFARFKGGKGVGTAAGALLALAPVEVAVAFAIWAAVTFSSGYVSLGSLSAAVALPLCLGIEKMAFHKPVSSQLLVFAGLLAGAIFFTHRSNIGKLLHGEENRFGSKKSSGTH